jgi:hypothetical protein
MWAATRGISLNKMAANQTAADAPTISTLTPARDFDLQPPRSWPPSSTYLSAPSPREANRDSCAYKPVLGGVRKPHSR